MNSSGMILEKGMDCLINNMGVVEAEQFISVVLREKMDYTKWQREYFDKKDPDEFFEKAVEYGLNNPFDGKKSKKLSEML